MEFRILGPLEVVDESGPVALDAHKQRALLGLLLLHASEVVPSDRLIDELWGEHPPATARKIVQTYVSQLRKALGTDLISTRPPGYLLQFESEAALDVTRFRSLADEARGLAVNGELERAVARYREGLALWRGPPLSDVVFESFARNEVERLGEERLDALSARIDCELALGLHEQLVTEISTLVGQYPLRERFREQLMLALYRSGRQADALGAYQDARRTLVDLGLEPGRELQDLEKAILVHDAGIAAPRPAERAPTNLPSPPTRLIGRERELTELAGLVSQARLVTLTGPGGSGKTRLALELAAELLERFPDGVFWVQLQEIRDPTLVLPAIADAVGADDGLTDHIGSSRMLLLLDNLEQVLSAAPELSELLTRTTEMKLVVTSREPLRIAGEYEYPVAPLSESDAIALFAERASAGTPDFKPDDTVAEICKRLDCLPLAIELAAARIKVVPSGDLLQLLDRRLPLLTGGRRGAPARQQTLRATIDWSYELLAPEERRLFARLAVFAGGCTFEAAEEVCDADLDTLASLVDKNLLRQDDGRYTMLETTREYGLEQLEASGEGTELRRGHAAYFCALLERVNEEADGAIVDVRDEDNVRRALSWALDAGEIALAHGLVWWQVRFWDAHGRLVEGRRWAEAVLERADSLPVRQRARALGAVGFLACRLGDLETAARRLDESVLLAREADDQEELAELLSYRGGVAGLAGQSAAGYFKESVAIERKVGRIAHLTVALGNLGRSLLSEGDPEDAQSALEESLRYARATDNPVRAAHALNNLGRLAAARGDLSSARSLQQESLRNLTEVRHPWHIAEALEELAAVLAAEGQAARAAQLWGAAEALREETAGPLSPGEQPRYDSAVADARSTCSEAAFVRAWTEGRTMTPEAALDYALEDSAAHEPTPA